MISIQQAIGIYDRLFEPDSDCPGRATEHETFWCIEHSGYCLQTKGVIVDKADGHETIMGSCLPLETYLSAHELGFKHRSYLWTITSIRSLDFTRRLLATIGYPVAKMPFDALPLQLEFSWLDYAHLPKIAKADYFDFEFSVSECSSPGCTYIGKRIPSFGKAKNAGF